jgi:hypothetical protein
MIDYLERLFFPDKRDWEGEQARPAPSPPGEEWPRSLAVPDSGEAEAPQDMAAVKLQREEVQTLAAADFGSEEPQSMAVAGTGAEEPQVMAEAALRSEEVQALRGVFPEGESPEKMAQTSLRGEEMPQSPAMTVPEQEAVQPLFAAKVREIGYEAGQMRHRIGNAPEEPRASRATLSGERGQELTRVSPAWEEPVSEAYRSRIPARYNPGEREEDLEHRLRRNSRRYDSGFFLY